MAIEEGRREETPGPPARRGTLFDAFDEAARSGRRRRKGGQPGNQNALKHGFYSRALNKARQAALKDAAGLDGLDEEIALLRLKLRDLLTDQPDRVDLHIALARTIAALLKANARSPGSERMSWETAIANVVDDFYFPIQEDRLREEQAKTERSRQP